MNYSSPLKKKPKAGLESRRDESYLGIRTFVIYTLPMTDITNQLLIPPPPPTAFSSPCRVYNFLEVLCSWQEAAPEWIWHL